MTSFGWKRKAGEKVSKAASTKFEKSVDEPQSDGGGCHGDIDWDAVAKRRKVLILEDSASKSGRLKLEGETLADAGRYWEAVKKWDEALQFTPASAHLHEMKSQVLMELHEVFPAVEAAQQAVTINPTWWVAYQTLGRAQLGMGEITMAIKSFSRAMHLNPSEPELLSEDLAWACSLRDQLRERTRNQEAGGEGGSDQPAERLACRTETAASSTEQVERETNMNQQVERLEIQPQTSTLPEQAKNET